MAAELCTIRVSFVAESDKQVLDTKRKIQESLKDVKDVRVDLSLMSRPATMLPAGPNSGSS